MATAIQPPCLQGLRADTDNPAQDGKTGVLVATILGSSLAFIVGSIINVALPAMQAKFGLDAAGAQWLVNAHLLPVGALVLIGGALGDHYCRKWLFIAGLCAFMISAFTCALAPTAALRMAARVLLGLGAAMPAPSSLSIIAATFSGEARAKAVGTWGCRKGHRRASARLVGGWIVDTTSWRRAFVHVAPIAVATLVVALRYISESREAPDSRAPLDRLGAALASAALTALDLNDDRGPRARSLGIAGAIRRIDRSWLA